MSAADAVQIVQVGDTVASNGYAGCGTPEALLHALGERLPRPMSPATSLWFMAAVKVMVVSVA